MKTQSGVSSQKKESVQSNIRNEQGKSSKISSQPNRTSALEQKLESQFKRQLQVISVVLLLLTVLILLSLISYSPNDEASTQLSFSELLGLMRGDELIKIKIGTINNWLGIIGAITANALYNYTIGYSIIFFPVILILWAKNLFFLRTIPDKLIKRTIIYLLLGTLFSSLMGTLTKANWLIFIPKEWSGAAGLYLATLLSNLIGNIGSLLIFLTAIIVTLMLTVKYNFKPIIEWFKNSFLKIKEKISKLFAKKEQEAEILQPETIQEELTFRDDEPARIIRNNLNIQINNPNFHREDNFDDINSQFNQSKSPFRNEIPMTMSPPPGIPINPNNESFNGLNNQINKKDIPNQPSIKDNASQQAAGEQKRPNHLPIIERIIVEEHITAKNQNGNNDFIGEGTDFEVQETISTKPDLTLNIQNENYGDSDDEHQGISLPPESIIDKELSPQPTNPLSTSILDEEINYHFPTLELLAEAAQEQFANEDELRENAKVLQEKLETFKVFIENLSVTPGPVVTQFEFVPAAGIKISKIESFADDMAMALKARGIRIIAPIPGKGTIGIEIPNQNPSLVRFISIVNSSKFQNTTHKLPIALGKTISGDVFCADLTRMPHLLIAGATGAGKSVGINTIIASLLYKMHPRNLKFVIVDPKKVELKQYSALENHFLAVSPDIDSSIVTDSQDAVIALKAMCAEMDLRYNILAHSGQRNILEYNQKVSEGKLKDDKEILHRPMPYIVVIIDELADLMLTAAKEVETPIIRLAQLARAVGIHLVLATQRPSVDVITGIIKANFPARIAYLVASKIDSRTILDGSGAEQLLGNGDMLFQAGGSIKPIRIQNAYISTDEIEGICNYISEQEGYSAPYLLPSLVEKSGNGKNIGKDDRDPLFEDAARLVIQQQQGSVSLIQRRLKVGYARAGRIVDELEAAGVVGPYDGSKARQVYFTSEDELDYVL